MVVVFIILIIIIIIIIIIIKRQNKTLTPTKMRIKEKNHISNNIISNNLFSQVAIENIDVSRSQELQSNKKLIKTPQVGSFHQSLLIEWCPFRGKILVNTYAPALHTSPESFERRIYVLRVVFVKSSAVLLREKTFYSANADIFLVNASFQIYLYVHKNVPWLWKDIWPN